MRKIILLLSIALCACDKDAAVSPSINTAPIATLDTVINPIKINIGDSWLYRRLAINQGTRQVIGVPDTLVSYKYVRVIKDTTIHQLPFLIFEAKVRDIEQKAIRVTQNRSALHIMPDAFIEICLDTITNSFASTMMLGRTVETDSIVTKLVSDSLQIFDVMTPIRFPLSKGDTQSFRKTRTSRAYPISQIYEGQEIIKNQGQSVSAWKFTRIFPAFFSKSITMHQWIGIKGLLRTEINWGTSELIDSLDQSHSIISSELIEYIGTQDVDESALKPWGK
jgi:hypothetical protein